MAPHLESDQKFEYKLVWYGDTVSFCSIHIPHRPCMLLRPSPSRHLSLTYRRCSSSISISAPHKLTGALYKAAIMAQIQLSPEEKRFCDLLNGFSQTLEPPVECRIAGGWVRDKVSYLAPYMICPVHVDQLAHAVVACPAIARPRHCPSSRIRLYICHPICRLHSQNNTIRR